MTDRILVISLSVIAVLALVVIIVFAFGTPQAPQGGAAVIAETPTDSTSAEPVREGEVPPPDPSSPLAIEIPGCVCHSDDPVLVEEHADYRMNQCFGCHSGGMPEMGQ